MNGQIEPDLGASIGAETSAQQALRDYDPLDLVGPLVDLGVRSIQSSTSMT